MLTLHIKKRRWFIALVAIVLLVFACVLGVLYHRSNEALAKQQTEAKAQIAKLNKKIAEIKERKEAERKAKEEADRKKREAAKKKAEAEAALRKQLQGRVVTPTGCAAKGPHSDPNKIDVVINKKRCFDPINFTPPDLVSYQGFIVSAKILPHLSSLFNAAAAAGVPLSLTSSYRSYSNQVTTYNHWVQVNGSYAAADKVSARPGYSEHQTGFAVDLAAGGCTLECFGNSAQYAWMKQNAHRYGFVERYPAGHEVITGYSPEAWHWRYVGSSVAQAMKSSGVKTLEQFWDILGGGY